MAKSNKNYPEDSSARRADDADRRMFDAKDPDELAKAVKRARETDKKSRRAKKDSDQVKRTFDGIVKKNFKGK